MTIPGVETLRQYQRGWLRSDVLAGLTVAAYFVPQVMAYAQLAGLPAVTGLWVALGPLVLYFFLGSSRLLSLGPESTTALLTATAIGPLAAGDPVLVFQQNVAASTGGPLGNFQEVRHVQFLGCKYRIPL